MKVDFGGNPFDRKMRALILFSLVDSDWKPTKPCPRTVENLILFLPLRTSDQHVEVPFLYFLFDYSVWVWKLSVGKFSARDNFLQGVFHGEISAGGISRGGIS